MITVFSNTLIMGDQYQSCTMVTVQFKNKVYDIFCCFLVKISSRFEGGKRKSSRLMAASIALSFMKARC